MKRLIILLSVIFLFGCATGGGGGSDCRRGESPTYPHDCNLSEKFCRSWYLDTYPWIKKDPYYSVRPYEHYLKHGKAEGKSSCPIGISNGIKVLKEIKGDSYFSLELANNLITAGRYSFPNAHSIIDILGVGSVGLDAGESIFSLLRDGDYLWASTENSGKIYRAKIGEWKFSLIKTLAPGLHGGAFHIRKIKGHVVAIGGGEIWVNGIGVVKRFGKDPYVKDVFEYNGMAVVPGYNRASNHAGYFVSTDLRNWAWHNKVAGARFISGATSPNRNRAALVGIKNYSGGQYHRDSAAIYMLEGGKVRLHSTFAGFDYISCLIWENDGSILVGLTKGWRSQSSGAQLVRIASTTQVLATFSEPEIRAIEIRSGKAICATRKDRVGGKIYEVDL